MRRRDVSATVGLSASLLMHGLAAWAMVRSSNAEAGWYIYLPPLVFHSDRRTAPAFFLPDREEDPLDGFGRPDGKGYAVNEYIGEGILHAPQGPQDQAWLSRDPVGPGARMPQEPSLSTRLPGQNGTGGPGLPGMPVSAGSGAAAMSRPPMQAEPLPAAPFGTARIAALVQPHVPMPPPRWAPAPVTEESPDAVAAVAKNPPATQPVEETTEPAGKPQSPLAVAVATPAALARATSAEQPPAPTPVTPGSPSRGGSGGAEGGLPGPPVAPADPAPMSDSESDAFARIGSAVIRPGGVEAKIGRAVRTVKPRLTPKAELDLLSIMNPRVVLRVQVNEKGEVTGVSVVHSSGSNEIDLPTRLSLYKWWFEPRKNKSGTAVPDIILLTVSWH